MQDKTTDALRAAMAALESQRATLGDEVLELALAPLRARLAALARPAGLQHRHVAVLFVDVVGSTAMAQSLDAEDTLDLLGGTLRRMAEIVEVHQGRVLRFTGDGVKAVFGMDQAREDDAERAVRAGLAMVALGSERAAVALRRHGVTDFAVRVGVHCGAVALGAGVEADNTAMGAAVNIAARMEQSAPPGTLRISHDTWTMVRGLFEVEPQPPLHVKGVEAPMQTYLVGAALNRHAASQERGLRGVATPLVGRAAELQRLHDAVAQTRATGRLHAVTLVADAGLGKSRLLRELAAGLGGLRQLVLRSQPDGMLRPWGLLRSLLATQCGVADDDSADVARHKVVQSLAPWFARDDERGDSGGQNQSPGERQAQLLGQLAGLDFSDSPHLRGLDSRSLRDQALVASRSYLRALAARDGVPPLLLVEDLHWADDSSLDWLQHLMDHADALPLALVMTCRPALRSRRPDWGPPERVVVLGPLAPADGEVLARALLQHLPQPPVQITELLISRAEGNPYYMEELLRRVIDDGVIDTGGAHWTVQSERLDRIRLPGTLVGLLQARLDALPAAERVAARQASVIGAVFWDDALQTLDAQALQALPALEQAAFVRSHARSAFEGTTERQFDHHLLHQVTYETVLKPDKRAAHARAARWLLDRSPGREGELAGPIAEHFERAGELSPAVDHWLRAAEEAAQREADTAALRHAGRGLALDDSRDLHRRLRLHRVRAQIHRRSGDADVHAREMEAMEALAERMDDDAVRLSVAFERAWRLMVQAHFAEAVDLARQRLARAPGGSPSDAGRLHGVIYVALARLGRKDEAMDHARQGLALAQAAGDLITVGQIQTFMGVLSMEAQRIGIALDHHHQALEAYRAAGSRGGMITVRINLAHVQATLGRLAAARELLLQTLAECRDTGNRRMEAIAQANLSGTWVDAGDCEAGYAAAMEGLRLAALIGESRTAAWAHNGAQYAAYGLGRLEQALEHARCAEEGFRTQGDPASARINAAAAARNLQALGRADEARAAAEALLAEADAAADGWDGAYELAYLLHQALAPLGHPRATSLLQAAYDSLNAVAEQMAAHVSRAEFLGQVLTHRNICAAWQAAQPSPPDRP